VEQPYANLVCFASLFSGRINPFIRVRGAGARFIKLSRGIQEYIFLKFLKKMTMNNIGLRNGLLWPPSALLPRKGAVLRLNRPFFLFIPLFWGKRHKGSPPHLTAHTPIPLILELQLSQAWKNRYYWYWYTLYEQFGFQKHKAPIRFWYKWNYCHIPFVASGGILSL